MQQIPHLVPNLRLALATLYSLPGGKGQSSSHEAHDYLLQFQARNPRRTLHSKAGSQQQQQPTNNFTDIGSTWLACVALVSSLSAHDPDPYIKDVHYTEALFAAQTLVHRLRRVKLAEAIDIEFEPTIFDPSSIALSPSGPEQILDGYQKWTLQHCYGATSLSSFGMLSQIIQSYIPNVDPQQQPNLIELEERIKGEISMMIIVAIMDALTKSSLAQTQQQAEGNTLSKIRPLLKTLASALALIAARMRYVSTSIPSPAPHTQPIVTTILGAISMLQPQVNQQESGLLQEAVQNLSFTCLTALPESVLTGSSSNGSGGGGAYGRFSLDPRCYTAVTAELKTEGISQMCTAIQNIINSSGNSVSPILILQMCEAWAKYVALPVDFVNSTIPLVLKAWEQLRSSQQAQPQALMEAKAAMAYWIAVMESGTWSIEQVLTSSLVQSKERSHQSNKKRQSSKSKKRHQQFLENRTTDKLFVSATKEVEQRGHVACTLAQQTLSALQDLLILELNRISELVLLHDDSDQDFQGDGPVGAITACANACLPYLLRTPAAHQDAGSMAMFATISQLIQQVCASPSRLVRSFASESLYTLHEALLKTLTDNQNLALSKEFLEAIVSHFFRSTLNLALQCGYPGGFFDDMSLENDDDLENERNDVRDVLRTISHISTTVNNGAASASLSFASSSILLRLLQACAQPIQEAITSNTLFSEPALHAFSALAKPINSAAILFAKNFDPNIYQDNIVAILKLSLEIVSNAGKCLLQAFQVASINEVLPVTRLYDLAIASLAPMFSTLCQVESMKHEVEATMRIGIDVAASSLMKIPELTGPSTLRQTRFDIRGAMRSPGGEDHAGVLALMRLANESGPLSMVFLRSKESMLVNLCELYQSLKRIEDQRGIGVFYGIGVLPKSRRILLGVICNLEALSDQKGPASKLLASMFEHSVTSIANVNQQLENLQTDTLSMICESAFDIAAFSPHMIRSLFDLSNPGTLQTGFLHVLEQVGNFGFASAANPSVDFTRIIGWNRVRASLFTLFKLARSPDLPDSIVGILTSLITSECEAATVQCSAGPTSSSRIFHEDVISEENIPSGLFIRVLVETLDNALSTKIPMVHMRNVLQVLYTTRQSVIRAMLLECPNPVVKGSFHDPRPIITETWFLCMNTMAAVAASQGVPSGEETIGAEVASVSKQLLVETFVAAISLLFYPSSEKTQQKRANDPGMCLDGPQGLVMMDFFVTFFDLGASMIQAGARELASVIPVNIEDPDTAGMAIIGAALFRGSQGGLPPWAVESVPSVYSALFKALNKNVDSFGQLFEISMSIRLLDNRRFGSVEGGSLLSGRFFETMKDKAKIKFIEQSKDHARIDTTASWRRLKTCIKQACGGKKKDTDFNQRPALTAWDTLDRV